MLLGILAAFIVFVLISSAGILVFNREDVTVQVATAFELPDDMRKKKSRVGSVVSSLGNMVGRFEGVVPRNKETTSSTSARLVQAGYRGESAIRVFYGSQFVLMLLLPLLSLVTGLAHKNYLVVPLVTAVIGYMLPNFWLGSRVKARQKKIRLALPDVLDLLIVCVEAGLSLDQATTRTADELATLSPEIADELGVVVLEQRAGCARSEAWKHFSDRSDVPSVRNVVTMLVQAEQFGTSIAKTLRVHSDTLRSQRIQMAEEMAAKTGIKMLIPLVIFIFPTIFVVTIGPAGILMMQTFSNNLSH